MNVLDLFSGIGGLALGLERAGMHAAAFCEAEPYCREVLRRRFPGAPCYDDVRTLTADRLRADGVSVNAIAGGFPCQDISYAGFGAGLAGERSGLFYEYARLIGELGPDIAVVENVSALLDRDGAVLNAFLTSGTMQSGTLYRMRRWDCHTCDDECSLWPTPTASMDGRGFGIPLHENTGLLQTLDRFKSARLVKEHGWRIHPNFTEALMGFPTGWSAIEASETH